jgi:hypothetical protein
MLRRCGRCNREKPLNEFAWRRKHKGQRDNYCQPCRAAYHREHYLKNRQKYIDSAAARRRRILDERVTFLVEHFRENPCADCGEDDVLVLEFDHIEDKEFPISKGLREKNWEALLAEMAKCEVVCANCHRRRTARRVGSIRLLLAKRAGEGN